VDQQEGGVGKKGTEVGWRRLKLYLYTKR
jgi:hypothetical protein